MRLIEQPPPIRNDKDIFVWDLVIKDMNDRNEQGKDKYGVYLQPNNGRDFLLDMYAELLDMIVYLRGYIYEQRGY